jgi:hypothetical protein
MESEEESEDGDGGDDDGEWEPVPPEILPPAPIQVTPAMINALRLVNSAAVGAKLITPPAVDLTAQSDADRSERGRRPQMLAARPQAATMQVAYTGIVHTWISFKEEFERVAYANCWDSWTKARQIGNHLQGMPGQTFTELRRTHGTELTIEVIYTALQEDMDIDASVRLANATLRGLRQQPHQSMADYCAVFQRAIHGTTVEAKELADVFRESLLGHMQGMMYHYYSQNKDASLSKLMKYAMNFPGQTVAVTQAGNGGSNYPITVHHMQAMDQGNAIGFQPSVPGLQNPTMFAGGGQGQVLHQLQPAGRQHPTWLQEMPARMVTNVGSSPQQGATLGYQQAQPLQQQQQQQTGGQQAPSLTFEMAQQVLQQMFQQPQGLPQGLQSQQRQQQGRMAQTLTQSQGRFKPKRWLPQAGNQQPQAQQEGPGQVTPWAGAQRQTSPGVTAGNNGAGGTHDGQMNRRPKRDPSTIQCRSCGILGHMQRYCPSITCNICQGKGHMGMVCVLNPLNQMQAQGQMTAGLQAGTGGMDTGSQQGQQMTPAGFYPTAPQLQHSQSSSNAAPSFSGQPGK